MSELNRALAHVQREMDKLIQDRAAYIAAGRADSYPEYRHVCGVILGLNYANNILNDLVQKMETSDD